MIPGSLRRNLGGYNLTLSWAPRTTRHATGEYVWNVHDVRFRQQADHERTRAATRPFSQVRFQRWRAGTSVHGGPQLLHFAFIADQCRRQTAFPRDRYVAMAEPVKFHLETHDSAVSTELGVVDLKFKHGQPGEHAPIASSASTTSTLPWLMSCTTENVLRKCRSYQLAGCGVCASWKAM